MVFAAPFPHTWPTLRPGAGGAGWIYKAGVQRNQACLFLAERASTSTDDLQQAVSSILSCAGRDRNEGSVRRSEPSLRGTLGAFSLC